MAGNRVIAFAPSASSTAALGNGRLVLASDTVPFSVWAAARHLHDYEDAKWTTVAALGDRDTICAIVGGIASNSEALGYDVNILPRVAETPR